MNYKRFWAFLSLGLVFAAQNVKAKAVPLEGLEEILALSRIPVVCAANAATFTANKSSAQQNIMVAADVVRLCG